MATLDVSFVLRDARFFDNLIVVKNTQQIGTNGRATNFRINTPIKGVVTANNGFTLDRLADGSVVKGAITIHTKHPLASGQNGEDADEIIWRNKHYIVQNVSDYAHVGKGFVCAVCILKPFSG